MQMTSTDSHGTLGWVFKISSAEWTSHQGAKGARAHDCLHRTSWLFSPISLPNRTLISLLSLLCHLSYLLDLAPIMAPLFLFLFFAGGGIVALQCCVSFCCKVAQSCPTLWDPTDCSLPGSSVHEIFQVRVLDLVAISFSRGSSWPRDRTRVSSIADRGFTIWATREAQLYVYIYSFPLGPPSPHPIHLGPHRALSWAPHAML